MGYQFFQPVGGQLGKKLATDIRQDIERKSTEYDGSTQDLMALVKHHMDEARRGSKANNKAKE